MLEPKIVSREELIRSLESFVERELLSSEWVNELLNDNARIDKMLFRINWRHRLWESWEKQ